MDCKKLQKSHRRGMGTGWAWGWAQGGHGNGHRVGTGMGTGWPWGWARGWAHGGHRAGTGMGTGRAWGGHGGGHGDGHRVGGHGGVQGGGRRSTYFCLFSVKLINLFHFFSICHLDPKSSSANRSPFLLNCVKFRSTAHCHQYTLVLMPAVIIVTAYTQGLVTLEALHNINHNKCVVLNNQ